tara:strand:- start:97 stop:579 length:483 start_codon:yes stop_codon:yes gene_type:complete
MRIQYYIIITLVLILFSCSDEGVNPIYGCTNEQAPNYNSDANIDDGSCDCNVASPLTWICDDDAYEYACYLYTYDNDIYDIFNNNGCLDCHTGISSGGLDLSTYSGTLNGGYNGSIISPCNPSESLLITTFNSGGLMCNLGICSLPDQSIIESWIYQGSQ